MRIVVVSAYLLLLLLRPALLRAEDTPASILEHTRSVYAALTSYSDTGTVLKEYTQTSRDETRFSTYFTRAPRHFLFDYRKPAGDRLVVWGDPEAFHAWWKATAQVTEYPNPNNTNAITLNDFPTGGAVTKIPPLLYSKASLPGAMQRFEPKPMAATDDVVGHKCYRLEGTTSDTYGTTGNQVNVRNLTVWIDASSYLVRKILEQAPAAPGTLNRVTTTFDPQANPKLNDQLFQFAAPR
jgi:outer membrane lipoprotein-sorting protein